MIGIGLIAVSISAYYIAEMFRPPKIKLIVGDGPTRKEIWGDNIDDMLKMVDKLETMAQKMEVKVS